ncbi:DNA recombination protein RmuC [Patescibacteria group bacterium]|nr:DNA recombination protein RmuC [Patescibacteria group bacterium]
MDPTFLLVIVIGAVILLGLYIGRKLSDLAEKQKPSDELLEYLKTTNTRLDEQNKNFTRTLQESTRNLNERLDNAAKVIGAVQKNIGEMSEIGRGMQELQQFLQSPKLRGNIGEQVLKDLITQMFPKKSFHLQYSFKSGEKVDAAITTAAGILPIDSKFPMENFQKMTKAKEPKEKSVYRKEFMKDIKKHVTDISRKYILPEEGTMDFALMYIPSEAVYYEVVNEQDLLEIAKASRVYPVSPTTLYAHLQTILLSFEGQKIESRAKEVFSLLRAIQKDYLKVDDNLSKLQRHLNNAYNMMSSVLTSFTGLGQKISSSRTLGGEVEKEVKKLEK